MVTHVVRRLLLGAILLLAALPTTASSRPAPDALRSPDTAIDASPSCAMTAESAVTCVVVGADRRVWAIEGDVSGAWSSWIDLGLPGSGADRSGGVVVIQQDARRSVYAIATNAALSSALYRRVSVSGAWGEWEYLGRPPGVSVYEIACVAPGPATVTCIARGQDSHLWRTTWNDAEIPVWTDGGELPGDPAPSKGIALGRLSSAIGAFYAYVIISKDGQALMYTTVSGAWSSAAAPTGRQLAQVACHPLSGSTLDCVFSDSAGEVWFRRMPSGGSSEPFVSLSMPPAAAAGVTLTHYNTTGLLAVATARDGRVYARALAPGAATWTSWASLGSPRDKHIFVPLVRRSNSAMTSLTHMGPLRVLPTFW